jgi:putative ABC transport system permease protein
MGSGLQEAITGQFGKLGADKLVVQNTEAGFGPPGSTAVVKLTKHDLDLVNRVAGVDVAVPRLIRIASVNFNKQVNFGYLASISDKAKDLKVIYDSMNIDVSSGRLLTKDDRGKVVVGDDYKTVFDRPVKVGSKLTIQGQQFEVVGILAKASTFTINSVVLMPESDMKRILNIGDEIDIISVQLTSKDVAEDTATRIENALRQDRKEKKGEEDFTVQTPQQSLQAINTVLSIINAVVVGIAAISLLVGGIGITNTMYTSVLERTKEIGVMKAVGARNSDVLKIFTIESGLIGTIGGAGGIIIGYIFGKLIEFVVTTQFDTKLLQIVTPWYLIVGCLLFSFIVGAVAGIVPARQASKIKPVVALRYE